MSVARQSPGSLITNSSGQWAGLSRIYRLPGGEVVVSLVSRQRLLKREKGEGARTGEYEPRACS